MATLFGLFSFLVTLYADGGYQGPELRAAVKQILARMDVEIVKRSDQAKDFVTLPTARSSNPPSPGSAAAGGSPRIGNASAERRSPSCASPPSASCDEN